MDVVTCVNRRNLGQLEAVYDLLAARDVPAWRLFTISPIGRAARVPRLLLSAPVASRPLTLEHGYSMLLASWLEGNVVPEYVGKYRLLEILGRGAMGTVYLAEDPVLSRKVAIKFMTQASDADETRFLQEARVVASLSHPHIVVLLDFGFHKSHPFLVMEYLPGVTLDKWRNEPHSLSAIVRAMRGVCLGLGHAHEHCVLHRDIKPSNILVLRDGESKLIDFGVAHAPESKLTASGMLLGTPVYLAPEIISNAEYSPKTDLYSLGVVFYELLVKENPFQASNLAACFNKILTFTPPLAHTINPEVPRELSLAIAAYMEKDPGQRPSDVEKLLAAIEQRQSPTWLPGEKVLEEAVTVRLEQPTKKARRAGWWLALGLVSLGAVIMSWRVLTAPSQTTLSKTAVVTARPRPTEPFLVATPPGSTFAPTPRPEETVETRQESQREKTASTTRLSGESSQPRARPTAISLAGPHAGLPTAASLPQRVSPTPLREPSPTATITPAPQRPIGGHPAVTAPTVAAAIEAAQSGDSVPAEKFILSTPTQRLVRAEQKSRLELVGAGTLRRGGQATVRVRGAELERKGSWIFLRGGTPTKALSIVRTRSLGNGVYALEIQVPVGTPLGVFTLIYQTDDGQRSKEIVLEVVL